MLLKDCNVSKASNISSLHRETQSFNTECNRVKILHVIDYQDMYWNKKDTVSLFIQFWTYIIAQLPPNCFVVSEQGTCSRFFI